MNLREAAQQALEAFESYQSEMSVRLFDSAVAALRAALAENQSEDVLGMVEPVAWLDPWTQANVTTDYDAYGKHGIPLYATPPKREPLNTDFILATWVEECVPQRRTPELVVAFARAIEQAHGIGGEE